MKDPKTRTLYTNKEHVI